MKRLVISWWIIGLVCFGANAITIDLSGSVKDSKGLAITGAVVSLLSDQSQKDTTDINGAFAIINGTSAIEQGMSGNRALFNVSLDIRDHQIRFFSKSSVNSCIITIYSSNGIKVSTVSMGKIDPGVYNHSIPRLSSGVYIVRVTMDYSDATFQFVCTGTGASAGRNISDEWSAGVSMSGAAVQVDTIVAKKDGFKTVKKSISSYDQKNIAIVMETASDTGPKLPPITDYSLKGPFKTIVEKNVGPNKNLTVFRPEVLGENGFLHAPIVFGPGIGQTVQPTHTDMLTNYASHGFVVVGTPVLSQGPGGAQNLQTMKDALNWIVKQNTTDGIYKGKLWVDHVVSMGFSVGGTSAVQLGGEAPIFTVVSIHGHTAEAALHGPMFQTTGTNDNVGMPLQQATFNSSKVQTFMATLTGAAHQYIESNGGGEERKAIVAWMRYWIYNDTGARSYFWGNDCILCKSPWTNPQRKNWQ